jgi:hypothetical protein
MTTNRSDQGVSDRAQFDNIRTLGRDAHIGWIVTIWRGARGWCDAKLSTELDYAGGEKLSARETRDFARALWSLMYEDEIDRDCFPDEFLDVVLPVDGPSA